MLIYSHCPEETSWQLLHPARSRTEYEEYPLVKSFFFSIGMQFLQQNRGIVFTKRGIVTITLGFTQPTAFTFKLTFGETGSDHLQVSDASYSTAKTLTDHFSGPVRAIGLVFVSVCQSKRLVAYLVYWLTLTLMCHIFEGQGYSSQS